MILGMVGGQVNKAVRRYGISTVGLILNISNSKLSIKEKLKRFGLLVLLVAVFSIGYGQESTIGKFIKQDWLIRIIYASILSIGFLFFKMWYAPLILIPIWQIRMGSFNVIGYDFLFEDMFRYLSVGILITIAIK